MKKFLSILSILSVALLSFTSCDDGYVKEKEKYVSMDGYIVVLQGTINGVEDWSGDKYNAVIAGFSDDSEYATIQSSIQQSGVFNDTLPNVPANTNTISVAITNRLRGRVALISNYPIEEGRSTSDTIKIDLGKIDLSMFGVVNQCIFQYMSCSRCHQGDNPAGSLNLTAEKSYSNLVNVTSHKNPAYTRVVPGDASKSFIYKVVTEGDDNVHYSHLGFFVEDDKAPLLDLLKYWIDKGATNNQ